MSVVTFSAKPCIVRPSLRRTPIAAILRGTTAGSGWSTSSQTPAKPVEAAGVRQAEFAEGVDEQALDAADVVGRAEPIVDVQDRIADELAGAVIGDVAAALDGDEFRSDRGRFAAQVVVEIGPRPVGEHVRMFEQQQVLLATVLEQRRLDRQRLAVRDPAEPTDPERRARTVADGHQPSAGLRRPTSIVSPRPAVRPRHRHSSVDQSFVSRISLTRLRNPAA